MVVFHLSDSSFGSTLLATLIGAFAAVVLGIPASLWVERLLERRRASEEIMQLRGAIREVLLKNRNLLRQMRDQLEKERSEFPTYKLDTTLLQSVSSRKYDVLKEVAICKAVDNAAYEFQHFNGKLDAYMRILPLSDGSGTAKSFLVQIQKSLLAQMPIVQRRTEQALSDLGFPVPAEPEDDGRQESISNGGK